MTGPARALAPLLRAAWLLAATLALTAGILGMHVLTAGHSSHGAAAGHASVSAGHTPAPAGHAAGHASVSAGHAAPAADAPEPAAATCGDTCPGVHEPGAPCVPTAPGNPVTLYPPQAGLAALPAQPGAGTRAPVHVYWPPSPTPCELSISRT